MIVTKHGKGTLKFVLAGGRPLTRVGPGLRSVLDQPGPRRTGDPGGEADAVLLDLEQAVAAARPFETKPCLVIRLDDVPDDLAPALATRPDALLLADCCGTADLHRLSGRLAVAEAESGIEDGSTPVLASVADSAAGLAALVAGRWLEPANRRLAALTWDAARLAADLGGGAEDALSLARCLVPVAARAAGLPALAADEAGATSTDGRYAALRRMGYTGAVTRLPGEVAIINAAFDPR